MQIQLRSQIASKVTATALAAAVLLGIGMSSGVVHAQPNQNGYDGDPCYIDGYGPFPDGTIHFFNGVTQICKGGEWVIYNPGMEQTTPTTPGHRVFGAGHVQEEVLSKD